MNPICKLCVHCLSCLRVRAYLHTESLYSESYSLFLQMNKPKSIWFYKQQSRGSNPDLMIADPLPLQHPTECGSTIGGSLRLLVVAACRRAREFLSKENGSPEEHAIYVWDHFIAQSAAENVFFVAHSYGGLAFVELIITKYVYELLEKDCNLKKISIPVDATESEPKSFIFMSEDALTNPQKLMVLIHGSGVVRAGQWARRLIINEDLDSGTQIPFIKRAVDEGYGVIVLNPNENYIEVEKPKIHVQSSLDSSDEPAEKRERKDKVSKETKKRRDFYEKYRNPQREKEMMQLYIRVSQTLLSFVISFLLFIFYLI
uniref:Protein FAM172A-like n=1 Tax=Castor canadensis TaxID=51338 RepID=A0A8B7UVJ2_CASCN|nr:protein FAM172A-like [Castor canadensis]